MSITHNMALSTCHYEPAAGSNYSPLVLQFQDYVLLFYRDVHVKVKRIYSMLILITCRCRVESLEYIILGKFFYGASRSTSFSQGRKLCL